MVGWGECHVGEIAIFNERTYGFATMPRQGKVLGKLYTSGKLAQIPRKKI